MPRIISIHEYVLRDEVDAAAFEAALREARERGLFQLPGLERFHFLRGIRGDRRGRYAAVWVYESRDAWEALWGPVDAPATKADYPETWKVWEDEVLAPFLAGDPDRITFTSYQELTDGR